jgi:hypothetical protein
MTKPTPTRRHILAGATSSVLFVAPLSKAAAAVGAGPAGAQLFFYAAGTAAPAEVYTTPARSTPHPHPLLADAEGKFANVYLDPGISYRAVLRNTAGSTLLEMDPYSPEGPVSAGLFGDLARLSLRPGVDVVQSSGHTRVGRGAARYVYDAQVDAAYVAANPLASFLSANGRGFRLSLDQIITPFMFGADSAATDNGNAINAWAAFIGANRVIGDWSGIFEIQQPILLGSAEQTGPATIIGEAHLIVTADITDAPAVITNHLTGHFAGAKVKITSPIHLTGWKTRRYNHGFLFTGKANLQQWGGISCSYAKGFGLFLDGLAPNNVFANHFGVCMFYGCGSGANGEGEDDWSLTADYSNRKDGGSGLSQTSTFNVSVTPPTWVDRHFSVFVEIGAARESLKVSFIDRAAGKITLQGYPDMTLPATGNLRYIFGGGWGSYGGDAGVQVAQHIVSTACAIGCQNGALYPGDVKVTAQHCSIAYVVGESTSDAVVGGKAVLYVEDCQTDVWATFSGEAGAYTHKIEYNSALSLSRVRTFVPRNPNTNSKLAYLAIPGLEISYQGDTHRWQNGPDVDGGWGHVVIRFQREHQVYALRSNAASIILDNSWVHEGGTTQLDYQRLFGYRSAEISVCGTGANGAPTSVTLSVPASRKINGGSLGAALVMTGWTGLARVHVECDPGDPTNILAYAIAGMGAAAS